MWMIRCHSRRWKCRPQRWKLKRLNFSAFNAKCCGWVRVCEWQRACMRLILITFYKNINDIMFTSAANENGAVWMNSLLLVFKSLMWIRLIGLLSCNEPLNTPVLIEFRKSAPIKKRRLASVRTTFVYFAEILTILKEYVGNFNKIENKFERILRRIWDYRNL